MSTEAEVPPAKKTKIDDDKQGDVPEMDLDTAAQSLPNGNEKLQKIQYGVGKAALDQLPDFVVGKILAYLDFQDKKNLREVCKRLAEVVMLEDHSLRQWTIPVGKDNHKQVSKHLAKARAKGITDLANFQIHFQVYNKMRQAAVVKKWKDHVTGLKTVFQPSLLHLRLPKLTTLDLITKVGTGPSTALEYYIRTCGATLKNLKINGTMYLPKMFLKEEEGGESPHSSSSLSGLQSLTLNGCFQDEFKMTLLGMCRNITHLDVGYNWYDSMALGDSLMDIPDESLKLPALKHLHIAGSNSFRFLMNNTSHLESLVVNKCDGLLLISPETVPVPENLPKLKTFVCLEHHLRVLGPVLQAAEQSLETLVVGDTQDMNDDVSQLNMEKLQRVVLSYEDPRDLADICLLHLIDTPVLEELILFDIDEETLLSFVDEYNLLCYCLHDGWLPSLEDFCVYVDKDKTLLEPLSKCKADLAKHFPQANFTFDELEFEPYLKKFIKDYCNGV